MDSIPYFSSIKSAEFIPTKDGFDHGYNIIIALDPMAGRKYRYSVLEIDCQKGTVIVRGRELPLKYSREIAKYYSEIIKKSYKRK